EYLRREQSGELRGRLFLPGFVEGLNKVKYYSIANVLVLPTHRDLWGIVINEAMCCRLPVVTTSAAGAGEMVSQGKNGFVVKDSDSHELETALESILESAERGEMMGSESFRIV